MTLFKYCPLLLVLLLTAGTAWGKDHERREKTARAACLSGDYARGAAILSELFVETEDAVFIYDQGRCFEQNHRCEEAIARFEEYLRVGKKLREGERAEVQKHIAGCKNLITQQATGPAPTGEVEQTSHEARARAAKKACLTGDPMAGAAILADLYLDTNNPTFLFNQGRCLEQNHRYQDAIDRFREYLEKAKDLSEEDQADTHRHIAKCESYLRETPVEAPKIAVEKGSVAESKPAEVIAGSTAPGDDRPGRGLRIAGSVVAGVGVAGLVTGLVLDLKVQSMSKDLEANWNSKTNSTRKDYTTVGWVAYGAGAACVVGGAILYYLGWSRGERSVSVAAVPAVGPDMAGTFLVGAF